MTNICQIPYLQKDHDNWLYATILFKTDAFFDIETSFYVNYQVFCAYSLNLYFIYSTKDYCIV